SGNSGPFEKDFVRKKNLNPEKISETFGSLIFMKISLDMGSTIRCCFFSAINGPWITCLGSRHGIQVTVFAEGLSRMFIAVIGGDFSRTFFTFHLCLPP
ncbi:MAG: hypothetical protein WBN77_02275, partial [Desulfobacterales bacterium]